MKRYYMIHRVGGLVPNKVHDTFESANNEAKRLAASHPGAMFTILEAYIAYKVPQPAPEVVLFEGSRSFSGN